MAAVVVEGVREGGASHPRSLAYEDPPGPIQRGIPPKVEGRTPQSESRTHRASLELTELLHAEYELQLIEAREKLEFNLQFLTTISTDTNQEKVFAKKIENNNSTIQNFAGELAHRCKKKMDANTRTPATAAPREPRLKPQPNLQKKYNIRDYENTQKVTFRNKQPHPPAECPRIAPLPTQ